MPSARRNRHTPAALLPSRATPPPPPRAITSYAAPHRPPRPPPPLGRHLWPPAPAAPEPAKRRLLASKQARGPSLVVTVAPCRAASGWHPPFTGHAPYASDQHGCLRGGSRRTTTPSVSSSTSSRPSPEDPPADRA